MGAAWCGQGSGRGEAQLPFFFFFVLGFCSDGGSSATCGQGGRPLLPHPQGLCGRGEVEEAPDQVLGWGLSSPPARLSVRRGAATIHGPSPRESGRGIAPLEPRPNAVPTPSPAELTGSQEPGTRVCFTEGGKRPSGGTSRGWSQDFFSKPDSLGHTAENMGHSLSLGLWSSNATSKRGQIATSKCLQPAGWGVIESGGDWGEHVEGRLRGRSPALPGRQRPR